MKVSLFLHVILIVKVASMAQKWRIEIIHSSLLEIGKSRPNVTAIVNAANVYMRGGL